MSPHFHDLYIKRLRTDSADALIVTLAIPPDLRDAYAFAPGQFLTLRASIDGVALRRSYSICSTPAQLQRAQEIEIGIKRVDGGVFSGWAQASLQAGDVLSVMTPDGRFTPRVNAGDAPLQRLGIAAGSGITPLLSIIGHLLQTEPHSRFTLVYGNRRTNSIMLGEALQDLKDRYPTRFSLIHVLSRQTQDTELLSGRIDAARIRRLLDGGLLAAGGAAAIAEAFICGPEGLIVDASAALQAAGLGADQVHSERFGVPGEPAVARAATPAAADGTAKPCRLDIVIDGKTHHYTMGTDERVLDVGLQGGLDLPHSCKGGVCCTCRARVLEGQVAMARNFTLEAGEIAQGYVLSCQASPLSEYVLISYDER